MVNRGFLIDRLVVEGRCLLGCWELWLCFGLVEDGVDVDIDVDVEAFRRRLSLE